MPQQFDHILLIGFGGPERPEAVTPFLKAMGRGTPIPEQRLKQAEDRYAQIGGASPYLSHAVRLSERLKARLDSVGLTLPLFLGMWQWHPFLKDLLPQIRAQGLKRGLAVVLAPHRCEANFNRALAALEAAQAQGGADAIEYEILGPWFDHPLFIQAQAEETGKILRCIAPDQRQGVRVIFAAHSIPEAMAARCGYAQEIQTSSAKVAEALGIQDWTTAYQSRGGGAGERWLAPDVEAAIHGLKEDGKETALLVPIGFLFDHMEVLYDLDIEARQRAQSQGLQFLRAKTVMDHPDFVTLLTELIQENKRSWCLT